MNSQPNPISDGESSFPAGARRASFLWQICKRMLWLVIPVVTLTVLFYSVENWRGARAWSATQEKLRKAGWAATWEEIVPEPIPDAANLALTRPFKAVLDFTPNYPQEGTNRWRDPVEYGRLTAVTLHRDGLKLPGLPGWRAGQRTDLKAWSEYFHLPYKRTEPPAFHGAWYRVRFSNWTEFAASPEKPTPAEDVLAGLSQFEADLKELGEAVESHPQCRFPLTYDNYPAGGILLPHLTHLIALSQMLRLRAAALVALGRHDEAFRDLKVMFRLADSIEVESFQISQTVRYTLAGSALGVVWEGSMGKGWSDAQWVSIRDAIAAWDFEKAHRKVVMAEVVWLTRNVPRTGKDRKLLMEMESGMPGIDDEGLEFHVYAPRGWYLQNAVAWHRGSEEILENLRARNPKAVSIPPGKYTRLIRRFLTGSMDNNASDMKRVQAETHLARTAVGIHRYRIRHQKVPETLKTLVPEFLEREPVDPWTGEPMEWERVEDDTWVLRCADIRKDGKTESVEWYVEDGRK